MTQAPTPGPLSGDDVKLLVKGDLLLSPNRQHILRFCRVYEPYDYHDKAGVWLSADSGKETLIRDTHYGDFTFIGRPDADGWMPWSGGKNPVPGQWVQVRQRGYQLDDESRWFADQQRWTDTGHAGDIIAFRLAPTAPVEASGSERDSLINDVANLKTQFERIFARSPQDRPAYKDGGQPFGHGDLRHFIEVLGKAEAALRPQPSGETREQLARIIDPVGWATWDHQSGEIDRMGLVGVERNGAIMSARSYVLQSLKKTDAILALLSARPLALGGQQGASCSIPPPGWTCSRISGHEGPCAASPADGEYE